MKEEKIISYKGFNSNLQCKGFQYEVGKEYEIDGDIKVCKRGFHACESPLEVLDHYPIFGDDLKENRFCVVEQSGVTDKERNSTKVCSSKIKIKAELKLSELINLGVEWIKEQVRLKSDDNISDSSGYSARIGSSGDYTRIGSSGDYAQIGSSGDYTQIGSSGDYTQIGSSGNSARIGSSGYSARIGSSGNSARIGSSGDSAQIGSSGDYAQIGSSGYSARIGSSGDSAQIGSSGDYAQIGSSGDYAQIGSSGNSARIGSSGDYAQIGSSGNSARINSDGIDSVICCAGNNSIVKAKIGSWVTLSEWVYSQEKRRNVPKCVKTEYVDGERIKADTWYKLVDGEFKEVKP